jgi:hypothetical protein
MKFIIPTLCVATLASCERIPENQKFSRFHEAWNLVNNPQNFGQYETKFEKLPLEANLKSLAWSDSYWPSNLGGISHRWNALSPESFAYVSPSQDVVKNMSPAEIAKLSPAEKYDLFMENFSYPTVKSEWQRTSKDDAAWEGLCHGWAPAALHFEEPKPVLIISPSGIQIPFASSDIKALLTYVDGELNTSPTRWLGTRCNIDLNKHPEKKKTGACKDTNAGAFHIVIANEIGVLKNGFVADIERGFEVWNQPILGYSTKVLGEKGPSPNAAPGTVKELDIETRMDYTVESMAEWNKKDTTSGFINSTAYYRYSLEVDKDGNILGGEWVSENRPDFLWMQETPKFSEYFSGVEEIYNISINTLDAFPEPR